MIDGFFGRRAASRVQTDKPKMIDQNASDALKELRILYAQKYWDAANVLVTLMYANNFAIYYAIFTNKENRNIIRDHVDIATAVFGVGLIFSCILLWRLFANESKLAYAAVSDGAILKEAISSAFELRLAAVVINYFFLVLVFGFIAESRSYMAKLFSFLH